MIRLALSIVVVALTACAATSRAPDAQRLAEYRQRWNHHEGANPPESSQAAFQERLELIDSPLFAALSPDEQHAHLQQAVRLGFHLKLYAASHTLARRTSEMQPTRVHDWVTRFVTAGWAGDLKDATYVLTQAARRWPRELHRFRAAGVTELVQSPVKSAPEREARFQLLEALYAADWVDQFGVAPAAFWGDLALELAERGQLERAVEVARHTNSPRFVVLARSAKAFDELVRQGGDAFDIEAASKRQVDEWYAAVRRSPRQLEALVHLCYALLDVGRYEEVYRITAAVMARTAQASSFHDVFDDDEQWFNWILNSHSQALEALQRWQDAEWELRAAADRLEDGHRNVSNTLRLAEYEIAMGRGGEALTVLAELPVNDPKVVTASGRVQWYSDRLSAARLVGDEKLASQCLEFVRAHQQDALGKYQRSLVEAGRLDDAAKLLIRRLHDPQTRADALLEVQRYHDPPVPAAAQVGRDRWRQVLERADVREAIARVGRSLDVPLPSRLP
ncbi:MAG TPA: hypothetical protein VMD49_11110 [Steroidobacteraceae bacterium]|nr:hypothetical protein [Steroidobacteraceae bacterium]